MIPGSAKPPATPTLTRTMRPMTRPKSKRRRFIVLNHTRTRIDHDTHARRQTYRAGGRWSESVGRGLVPRRSTPPAGDKPPPYTKRVVLRSSTKRGEDLLEGDHLAAAGRRRDEDDGLDARGAPGLDAVAHVGGAAE